MLCINPSLFIILISINYQSLKDDWPSSSGNMLILNKLFIGNGNILGYKKRDDTMFITPGWILIKNFCFFSKWMGANAELAGRVLH